MGKCHDAPTCRDASGGTVEFSAPSALLPTLLPFHILLDEQGFIVQVRGVLYLEEVRSWVLPAEASASIA